MEGLSLRASSRNVVGKKTRFLRRQGTTPVHLFGHNLKSVALQCDTAELQSVISQARTTKTVNLIVGTEKRPRTVFIREIQKEAGNGALLHVDFYQVKKTESIKTEVPIVLVGEAPAMKLKGRSLMQTLNSLSIECLPDKLPPQIEVDLSPLEEVDQTIHVRDIVFSPGIKVHNDPDQLVVKMSEAVAERVEEEEEEVEAEAKAEVE